MDFRVLAELQLEDDNAEEDDDDNILTNKTDSEEVFRFKNAETPTIIEFNSRTLLKHVFMISNHVKVECLAKE